jgi:hypothetical protein
LGSPQPEPFEDGVNVLAAVPSQEGNDDVAAKLPGQAGRQPRRVTAGTAGRPVKQLLEVYGYTH